MLGCGVRGVLMLLLVRVSTLAHPRREKSLLWWNRVHKPGCSVGNGLDRQIKLINKDQLVK